MTMNWEEDVSEETRNELIEMGNYGPTVNEFHRELKGTAIDFEDGSTTKDYLSSNKLRNLAAACIEAADWLDKRAQQ